MKDKNEWFKYRLEKYNDINNFYDIVDAFYDASYLMGQSYLLNIDEELRKKLADVIIKYMDEIRNKIEEG